MPLLLADHMPLSTWPLRPSNETGCSSSPYDVRLRVPGDSSANTMQQGWWRQCFVRHDASLLLQLLHPTHSALSIQMSSKLVHTGGT